MPAMPPSAMMSGKVTGSVHTRRPPICAPQMPTASMARRWSRPKSGCSKPLANPPSVARDHMRLARATRSQARAPRPRRECLAGGIRTTLQTRLTRISSSCSSRQSASAHRSRKPSAIAAARAGSAACAPRALRVGATPPASGDGRAPELRARPSPNKMPDSEHRPVERAASGYRREFRRSGWRQRRAPPAGSRRGSRPRSPTALHTPSPKAPSLAKTSAITAAKAIAPPSASKRAHAALAGILDRKEREPAARDHDERGEAGQKRQDGDEPFQLCLRRELAAPGRKRVARLFSIHPAGWVAISRLTD